MSTTTDTIPAARQSGLLPAPLSTLAASTAQSTQTGSSNIGALEGGGGSTNFIYIYSFLSTLFILLCIAILVLLRALVRRRRLDRLFNHEEGSSTDGAQSAQQRRRRQKKRPHVGSKPCMSNAWIGNGPVPASLSTEALLHAIQPFSIARTPDAPLLSNDKEKKPAVVEIPVLSDAVQEIERKPQIPRALPFWRIPSSSSCTLDHDKSAVSSETGHATTASGPTSMTSKELQISKEAQESKEPREPRESEVLIDQLCIGFLIAMPRSRVGAGAGSEFSSSHASKESIGPDEWSSADSRWPDYLCEGELPELNVGISTVYVPIRPDREAREHRRRR